MLPPQNRFVAKNANNEPRRGSTSAVGHKSSLPSKINNRSQSLDELESKDPSDDISVASEGASDDTKPKTNNTNNNKNKINKHNNNNNDKNQPNANKDKPPARPQRGDRAKSIDPVNTNIVNKGISLNDSETNSIGSSTSLTNAINKQPNLFEPDDAKSCSTTCSQPDSIDSQSSDKKGNLLNRYAKKVRSLIKK